MHPFVDAIPEHPAILQVIKEPDDTETFGGEFWHCDISFTSPPAAVSILHACELPPIGGDTLFAKPPSPSIGCHCVSRRGFPNLPLRTSTRKKRRVR